MEYSISKEEVIRRKIAYIRLSISLLVGTVLVSIIPYFNIPIYIYFIITVSLFLIGVYSFSFFKKLLPVKILLTETTIERLNNKVKEDYLLSDIYRIDIKYTTNNTIREIYIEFENGKKIFATALERFDEFRKELLKKSNKGIVVKEIHEHIDFDHPMFYTLLGLFLGVVIVLLIKGMNELSARYLVIGLIVCVIYIIALSVYLILTKQITRRIGKN
jgi:hypothetical protein